jgi:hypothetical protein
MNERILGGKVTFSESGYAFVVTIAMFLLLCCLSKFSELARFSAGPSVSQSSTCWADKFLL